MADEFLHLPQEIIHRIQSQLNSKQAARTSILSKSWFAAWSTRPILILDENDFRKKDEDGDNVSRVFSIFSTNTLNRYTTLYLKPDKFVLRMVIRLSNVVANALISSALKLGVTEIELENLCGFLKYTLPAQVFASTSLTRISVNRYVIVCNRVLCSRLKSLELCHVDTTDDVVRNILLNCPLIENLDLVYCVRLDKLNVSNLINLVEFRLFTPEGTTKVEFNGSEFRYLCALHLRSVTISHDFFTKFSCMFPCIEDLTLGYCDGYEEVVNISSHSLKCLNLYNWRGLKEVQLNVPNISKIDLDLKFGIVQNQFSPLPSLSFGSVSNDWQSYVTLCCFGDVIDAYWFVNLRKFLIELSLSRICMHITFFGKSIISGEEIPRFPCNFVVENLTVCACSSSNTSTTQNILLGLSRICSPSLITECKGC